MQANLFFDFAFAFSFYMFLRVFKAFFQIIHVFSPVLKHATHANICKRMQTFENATLSENRRLQGQAGGGVGMQTCNKHANNANTKT